jgi:uncharacterized protein YkwD
MPVTFRCPCGTTLRAASQHVGRATRCPSCGAGLLVPRPDAGPRPARRRWPWLAGGTAVGLVLAVGAGLVVVAQRQLRPAHPPNPVVAQAPPRPAGAAPDPQGEATSEGPAPRLPASPQAAGDTSGLDRLNAARTAAGLPRVTPDATLSGGCQAHAEYLARNLEQLRRRGLPTNDETSDLPGSSTEGKQAAKVAFGGYTRQAAADLVDEWLATVFIRPMLLDPELQRVGWGKAHDARGGWFAVLDVSRGRGTLDVVVYPADGQKDVPTAYPGTELPDPIPQAKTKRAGYPVTITFPLGATVRKVEAVLSRGAEPLPVWLSTPEKPAQDAGRQRNTVCLIVHVPLEENTTYTVTVSAEVDGTPWQHQGRFTTGRAPGPAPEAPTDREALARAVLAQVNGYRKRAGVAPVVLDEGLSRGCQAHAEYLVRNAADPSTEGVGGHEEDPKLPGHSAAGRKAGLAADIAMDIEPLRAVPEWMATLFHRVPILDPDLRRIGFGAAEGERPHWRVVVDVNSGHGSDRPVRYPADGQKDVPLAYHPGERPDPIPESKDKKPGFPVSVAFPRGATVTDAAAHLTDADGNEVAAWVSTPEKTVDRDLQRNSVCLVARQPLRPGTRYTATVTARVDGAAWKRSWSFTTRKGR